MGAEQFEVVVVADTAKDAFVNAVEAAAWEYGHGGYTGTIAEKNEFREFGKIKLSQAREMLDALDMTRVNDIDSEIRKLADQARPMYDDKWGAAVCFELVEEKSRERRWLFCGWASS